MERYFFILLAMFFVQCSSRTVDQNIGKRARVEVQDNILNDHFGGIGFHVFYHSHDASQTHYEQVFAKRWRELNPSFARITDFPRWDKDRIDKISTYLEVMKETDTELYFTTWGANAINDYRDEMEYVRHEVDNLEYLKQEKDFENINYYCMTNELSLESWASMVNDLERFKRIQQLFYDEFNRRNLDIKLLATDASPISNWPTIEWAAEHMDGITGVYGGHHYINGYDLFDVTFYPFFLDKIRWGTGIASSKGKGFIIGEFGPKQSSNFIDSVKHDACIYNNTPLEAYVGIQVAEAITAMINGGVYAASYWTFSDFPSTYRSTYVNKWGVFKWEIDDYTTRPNYYALGLLTKFFRGPAQVHEVITSDSLLRSCAVENLESGAHSIAVINRHTQEVAFDLEINAGPPHLNLRKYVYDPQNVPFNYFGDLQPHSKEVEINDDVLVDTIPGQSLVVYTSAYDNEPPAPVQGISVTNKELEGRPRTVVQWDANEEQDLCYYRIYRSEKKDFSIEPMRQIGTTINTEFVDRSVHGLPPYYYRVVAVDQSGNSSD